MDGPPTNSTIPPHLYWLDNVRLSRLSPSDRGQSVVRCGRAWVHTATLRAAEAQQVTGTGAKRRHGPYMVLQFTIRHLDCLGS